MKKTRFVICGLSTRAVYHFALPLLGQNWERGNNFNRAVIPVLRHRILTNFAADSEGL